MKFFIIKKIYIIILIMYMQKNRHIFPCADFYYHPLSENILSVKEIILINNYSASPA